MPQVDVFLPQPPQFVWQPAPLPHMPQADPLPQMPPQPATVSVVTGSADSESDKGTDVNDEIPLNVMAEALKPTLTPRFVVMRRLTTKQFWPAISQCKIDEEWAASEGRPQRQHWTCHSFPDLDDCQGHDRASGIMAIIDRFIESDAETADSVCVAWESLIIEAYPEMDSFKIRDMLLLLAMRTFRNRADPSIAEMMRDSIEYCAGAGFLTLGHIHMGLRTSRLDKHYCQEHDCLSPGGLRLWLDELSMIDTDGLVWLALQCSSFSGVCRGQSMRDRSNNYEGDTSRSFVRYGNDLTMRGALLYFISWLTESKPVLEQPVCSVMPCTKPMKLVLDFSCATRTVTWLGAFGAETQKPLQLIHTDSNPISYQQLRRARPESMTESLTVAHPKKLGKKRQQFSGRKIKMKASEAYPYEFGLAVAKITWLRCRSRSVDVD